MMGRRFLILCAVLLLLTPHSSLDSEIDVNASYLENAILVTADLNTTFGHRPIYTSRRF